MLQKSFSKLLFLLVLFALTFSAFAQQNAGKKNARPTNDKPVEKSVEKGEPVYFYEFSRDGFTFSKIIISHDEKGLGEITFLKEDYEESYTDPVALSSETVEKLKTHWEALNFLESDENYQYEKDYSHLGNIKIKMKKDGRERATEFNWTDNEDAKALMNEYRKITNLYTWLFEINVSRKNQPLESPRIVNNLDGLIRRNEIPDANQLIPFLKELSDDERIPLISRNQATRIVKRLEKQIAKSKDKN